jgi:hypothetical protein
MNKDGGCGAAVRRAATPIQDRRQLTVGYFLYKLIPPRPSFDQDMSDSERAIMGQHIAYWKPLAERGVAIVFAPVNDPAGAWGLAVVEAENKDVVQALGLADPAITSQLARFEIYALPGAIVAPAVSPV